MHELDPQDATGAPAPSLGSLSTLTRPLATRASARALAPFSFGVQRSSVQTKSGRMSYFEEGRGATVLLLHGAPMTSLAFVRLSRELATTCRVVAPDLPGFGYSEPSDDFTGSLHDYATSIVEFCEALDLRDMVVFVNDSSASMGLNALSRVSQRVAGIVVADTVPIPLTGRATIVRWILKYVMASRLVRWLNRRFNLLAWVVANLAPGRHRFDPSEREALTIQFDTPRRRERILDVFEAMGRDESFMAVTAEAVRTQLAQVPALVLYGQLDPMRFVGGPARYCTLFENSSLAIVPREEHFPILGSAPRVARAMLDFMQTLESHRLPMGMP